VSLDRREAAKWYLRSAAQGNDLAELRLGWIYDIGLGVDPDPHEAAKWYRLSAKGNNAEAQCRLGRMLEEGRGQARDLPAAISWYRRAADQGNTEALWRLGTMYRDGDGVPENRSVAIALYRLSAGMDQEGRGWARPLMDSLFRHLTMPEFDAGQDLVSRMARGGAPLTAMVDAFEFQQALDSTVFPVYRNPCDFLGFP